MLLWSYYYVTMVILWRYYLVAMALLWCNYYFTIVLLLCCYLVTKALIFMLLLCYYGVTIMLLWRYYGVTIILLWIYYCVTMVLLSSNGDRVGLTVILKNHNGFMLAYEYHIMRNSIHDARDPFRDNKSWSSTAWLRDKEKDAREISDIDVKGEGPLPKYNTFTSRGYGTTYSGRSFKMNFNRYTYYKPLCNRLYLLYTSM